ncbi:DUF2917 domain-containing protein [Geomonas sp.]|uniref:DUF2917 domain-containing protein n=1 Tax=Geomonas sp. TaxID=2651584 RepID=UPI002B4A6244|nr:DUF2917 domain-containing protein [Geomonas sp.]HJV36162.1 DUF2917 domain-containing protein [Geomonas sp.]
MEIRLEDREVLGIDGRNGYYAVRCLEGSLYVTRTGDARDYCLRPGQQVEIEASDHTVVEAVGAARLKCVPAPAAARHPGTAEAWHLVGSM